LVRNVHLGSTMDGRDIIERVLVVEDDVNARDALASALGEEGFDVVTASDGLRALELFDEHPFGLVLTDIRMPGIGGLELLRRLAGRPHPPKVIVMSAEQADEVEPQARHLGAVAFIPNPIQIDEVVRRLRQACP